MNQTAGTVDVYGLQILDATLEAGNTTEVKADATASALLLKHAANPIQSAAGAHAKHTHERLEGDQRVLIGGSVLDPTAAKVWTLIGVHSQNCFNETLLRLQGQHLRWHHNPACLDVGLTDDNSKGLCGLSCISKPLMPYMSLTVGRSLLPLPLEIQVSCSAHAAWSAPSSPCLCSL